MAQEMSVAELRRLAGLHKGLTPESWLMDWAAGEIDRLREALERLEVACDTRAALLTPEAYLLAETAPGMGDALEELDDARRHARQVLPSNAEVKGAAL